MTEESSRAIEYLECRQKKIIGDEKKYQRKIKTELKRVSRKLCKEFLKKHGKELTKKEKSFLQKNTEEYFNQLIETQHSTVYENPILISILHDLNEQLHEGAENIKIKTHGMELSLKDSDVFENPPYVGTLPTGEVNAQIRYFSSTKEYLIIFQDEIFNFCNLFSKIIALSFPYMRDEIITERDGKKIPPIGYKLFSIDEKNIKETIENNPQIFESFEDLFTSYIVKGKPGLAKQYLIDPRYEISVENLRNGMELFILGHEYAHKFFGHVGDSETKLVSISKSDAKKMIYDWEREYEADYGGLIFALGALSSRYNAVKSYWGTELILTGFEIVQRSLCILENGHDHFYWRGGRSDGPLGTHPPPDSRRERLREIAKKLEKDDITKYAEKLDIVIQILWNKLKVKFIEMHNKNIRPHNIWRINSELNDDC